MVVVISRNHSESAATWPRRPALPWNVYYSGGLSTGLIQLSAASLRRAAVDRAATKPATPPPGLLYLSLKCGCQPTPKTEACRKASCLFGHARIGEGACLINEHLIGQLTGSEKSLCRSRADAQLCRDHVQPGD